VTTATIIPVLLVAAGLLGRWWSYYSGPVLTDPEVLKRTKKLVKRFWRKPRLDVLRGLLFSVATFYALDAAFTESLSLWGLYEGWASWMPLTVVVLTLCLVFLSAFAVGHMAFQTILRLAPPPE
jgi:hypothetical protein